MTPLRLFCCLLATLGSALAHPNFLVIAVDDLRPALGAYGAQHMHTPYIDALAESGLVFERAYAQCALCGPSRNSIFSGARPDTTRVYRNSAHFREALPDVPSLPEFFKRRGYHSRGLGAEETVVALWFDNGYQLGDHGMWSKYTNYEAATRVPLIVRDPRLAQEGGRSRARVERIDLYPTLVDLAGFERPEHLEGDSLVPLLRNPQAREGAAADRWHRHSS